MGESRWGLLVIRQDRVRDYPDRSDMDSRRE